ncbi:MAG: PfkB family carbohydrate kinase, partial [Patescibacteria group bacterium]
RYLWHVYNMDPDFFRRHPHEKILEGLESIRGLKMLVIGETVIDEYRYVKPLGLTPKGNVVVFNAESDELMAGGIVACANHAAGFVDRVDILSMLGTKGESYEELVRSKLKPNVSAKFFYRKDAATIRKTRYVDASLNKLFSVYQFLEDRPVSAELDAQIREELSRVLPEYDVVICLDYGHGMLSAETMRFLGEKAKFLAVNAQTNGTNIGYNLITKYPKADFICLDELEMRLAAHDRLSPAEELLPLIASRVNAKCAIVTRGHKGCLTLDEQGALTAVGVTSSEVVDTVGSGDAFLAIAAPCAAVGLPMEMVGFIGNAVGALAVGIVGNRGAVDPDAVRNLLRQL